MIKSIVIASCVLKWQWDFQKCILHVSQKLNNFTIYTIIDWYNNNLQQNMNLIVLRCCWFSFWYWWSVIRTVSAALFLTGLTWDNSLAISKHRVFLVSKPGTSFLKKSTLKISPSSLIARIITMLSSST